MEKPIVMHYPVDVVLKYAKGMLENIRKENGPAEVAMFEDIVTMLGIAEKNMISVPAASRKDSKK